MTRHIVMFMFGSVSNVPPAINEGSSLAASGDIVRIMGIRRQQSDLPAETPVRGFTIHRMSLLSRKLFGDYSAFELVRYLEFAVRSFLWGIFRRADIIVAHDLITLPFAYPLARLRRKPIVYRAHELWAEQAPDFPRAHFWKRLDVFFSRRVDLIVSPETNRANVYAFEYGSERPVLVVFNTPRLIPRPASSPLKTLMAGYHMPVECVVYYHGGIGFTRCTDKLVESMQYVEDGVSLVLVGGIQEDFRHWCGEFLRDHRLTQRVLLLDAVPHGPELFALCAGANVGVMFVKPDCRNNVFNATATNKAFEYMMMGIPLLATNIESHRALVERSSIGLCVNSEDPRDIARGISIFHRDPISARKMGERGRKLTEERYNWEREFPRLRESYEDLLK